MVSGKNTGTTLPSCLILNLRPLILIDPSPPNSWSKLISSALTLVSCDKPKVIILLSTVSLIFKTLSSSAFKIAQPPGGKCVTIICFSLMTLSIFLKNSKWLGPMAVITPMRQDAKSVRYLMSPGWSAAISRTKISGYDFSVNQSDPRAIQKTLSQPDSFLPGDIRPRIVNGTPISLL